MLEFEWNIVIRNEGRGEEESRLEISIFPLILYFIFLQETLKRNIVVIDILFSLSQTHTHTPHPHTHSFHSTVKTFLLNMHKRKSLILLFIWKGISPHFLSATYLPFLLFFSFCHRMPPLLNCLQ